AVLLRTIDTKPDVLHVPLRRNKPPERPGVPSPRQSDGNAFAVSAGEGGWPPGSGRNIGQLDHVLANPIVSHKAKRRPGSGEIGLAVTKHDGVQVDTILVDQTKLG